ncbi:AbrB family transcriptional regulator [Frankia sp. CNm7]|uniref:AbrB family transcriptional regulator n=1 Tax=Frankia nepalensis TaxID=1836974 RepID=A0A937RT68_9ACTN|nr:AbrB family transcriptional regulator [Frankia nepalensis]MBL7500494.1 AbrB family transcriptional regulator [Frankia nepalensis]MBL7511227.1 AbrB family transcriptional regulator [Frankia nepalensis]MBL7523363.1 AbrB family transcriptional regulator [Frankia nepalensis]MBL7631481.1 AbrB family transcriptional regulator [Frankia nepalensis]
MPFRLHRRVDAARVPGGGGASPRAVLLIITVTLAVSVPLSFAGVPSPVLFGSLVGGMAYALGGSAELTVPRWLTTLGQGLLGVVIGTSVSYPALRSMGGDTPAILAVTLGTVAISLGAGRVLAMRRDVSQVTGAFAMIAGGASGVVAVARDLGADDRVVTVAQYLRVFVVVVTMPLVASLVFRPALGAGTLAVTSARLGPSLLYVAASLGLGLLAARVLPFPTSTLLAPLAVASVIVGAGWLGPVDVPVPLQWFAYAVIGVQVGLRFTRASLRSIARMLPAIFAIIMGMIVASAAMGAVLAVVTPVDGLTAYLATTPGGLFAVLATAADSGSDVTYVTAVQVVRLLVVLVCTPLLAKVLARRG